MLCDNVRYVVSREYIYAGRKDFDFIFLYTYRGRRLKSTPRRSWQPAVAVDSPQEENRYILGQHTTQHQHHVPSV